MFFIYPIPSEDVRLARIYKFYIYIIQYVGRKSWNVCSDGL